MTNLENILEETLKTKLEAYEATRKVRQLEEELLYLCIKEAPEVLTINYGRLCRRCHVESLRSRFDNLQRAARLLKAD